MKLIKFFCLLIVIISCSCNSQTQKINGLSFVASRDSITEKHVIPAKNTNANYVSLMPFGVLSKLDSPELWFDDNRQWFGETSKGIIQYANQFRKANIKIMLKPQLWVRNGDYTGFLAMKTEEDWLKLEKHYEKFILFHAKNAANINAEIFCIGTELEKFVLSRPIYWRNLIQKIKQVYKGKLTYAANWDEYKRLLFWSQLDFIGIDAYFPLSEDKTPTIETLKQGWEIHKNEIISIHQKFKKPILFTEFGYRSLDFALKQPWKVDRITGGVNMVNQVNGLEAIHQEFWNEDWFAGGFVWKWFHNHDKVGGEKNNRFTPQNKLAEKAIRKLYKQ